MKKICFFIGSRANYGRLKMVIDEAIHRKYDIEIILASQGIKVKLPKNIKKKVKFTIDGLMHNDTHSNMVFTESVVSEHVSNYLKDNQCDLCFVHGDRYENLGFAIAASFNNIPIAHTEGGERSGCIDNKIRNAITALADIHFVTSLQSITRLQEKSNVFLVGSTAIDYISSLDLRLPDDYNDFGLVLVNPNTTDYENPLLLTKIINKLAQEIDIIWINSNVDPGSKNINKIAHKSNIRFEKDLTPEEFYTYLYNCNFFLGNSSAGIKEASYCGIPYICIGSRQDNREKGKNCIDVKYNESAILNATKPYINSFNRFIKDNRFGNGDASKKIFDALGKLFKEGKI